MSLGIIHKAALCIPSVRRLRASRDRLQAYLLGGAAGDDIVLPVHWAASQPALRDILAPLWNHGELFKRPDILGGAFWMRRGNVS